MNMYLIVFVFHFFSDGFVWWIYDCRNTIVLNWSWINSINVMGVYLVYSNPLNLEETLDTRNLWRKHHIDYIQSWKLCLAFFGDCCKGIYGSNNDMIVFFHKWVDSIQQKWAFFQLWYWYNISLMYIHGRIDHAVPMDWFQGCWCGKIYRKAGEECSELVWFYRYMFSWTNSGNGAEKNSGFPKFDDFMVV